MKRAGQHDRNSGRIARRLVVILALSALVTLPASASATSPGFSASVGGLLPDVQHRGSSYLVIVNVKRTGTAWISKFCLDFGDDNNSWQIIMPGMRAYNGDVFCYGTLRSKRKQFLARIIPAKAGEKKLELCLGHATIYPVVNNAVLEGNELCWSRSFVLV